MKKQNINRKKIKKMRKTPCMQYLFPNFAFGINFNRRK